MVDGGLFTSASLAAGGGGGGQDTDTTDTVTFAGITSTGDIRANGDIIAVGAPFSSSGSVKVFRRDTSTALGWTQIGSDIEGEAAGDNSGYSIALYIECTHGGV